MPLSGGTAGAHDDAMHQGSAKRDVMNGVAGLDAAGDLLAKGSMLYIARSVAEVVALKERTSGETIQYWERIGAADYDAYLKVGGAAREMQHAGMKDVNNGIASLDSAGSLLVPGSKIYYTRDGSNDVHIYERTSDEEAYAFHRVGADDYTLFVKESNVWKQVQTESMKDVANGIAGLDANMLLSSGVAAPFLEEYSNHLGATDNFTQTGTAGNGTANTDAANHEMDLSTGITVVGRSIFETKKTWSLDSDVFVGNFLVQNIVNGDNAKHLAYIGLRSDFTDAGEAHMAVFKQDNTGGWHIETAQAMFDTTTGISPLSNGDVVSIVATSSSVRFFNNGVLLGNHTTYIPSVALHMGAVVHSYSSGAANARTLSIDMMGMKKWC